MLRTACMFALALTGEARPHSREDKKTPKKSLKDRLEKFDRLYDMAGKGKANIPNLKERVEELKQREASLLEKEEGLETPKMPVLEHNPFSHDPADHDHFDMDPADMMRGEMADDPNYLTPEEQAENKMRREKSKARMERMKGMSTDERLEFLKKERASGKRDPMEDEDHDMESMMKKRAKAWKSKDGSFGPPVPSENKDHKRRQKIAALTKDERHAHIREHQQTMQQHRENMENWRETHAGYMDERRDIMDQYRQISHEIREAIFANRDL